MRVAVYAGTFDPITLGHLSVLQRGARLFQKLWVLVAVNPRKDPLFSGEERVQMIQEVTTRWPNVQAAWSDGFVVAFARTKGASYLVRGVRGATDAEEEITLANLNHQLAPEIQTVFIPAHPDLSDVSSSKLKALASDGLDISRYCPPGIEARLLRRITCNQGGEGQDRRLPLVEETG